MKFEVIFLGILLLVGVVFFSQTFDLTFMLKNGNIGAGFLPRIVAAILIFLILFYLSTMVLKKPKREEGVFSTKSTFAKQLFLLACIIVSIFLVDIVGMLTTLTIMITVILFALEKVPLIKSFVFGIVCSACLYLVFVQLMNLKIPSGIFI